MHDGVLECGRLGEARDALDENVAARDGFERPLEHLVLPGDDPLDLDERLLQPCINAFCSSPSAAVGSLSGADMCAPRV